MIDILTVTLKLVFEKTERIIMKEEYLKEFNIRLFSLRQEVAEIIKATKQKELEENNEPIIVL